jgi:hypothetical protein
MMTLRRTFVWLVAVGAGLLLGGQLGAEPPSWEGLQSGPILMRNHLTQIADYGGSATPYISSDGIFQLDPDGDRLTVLRRFTVGVTPASTGSFFLGNNGFLTVKGDRVLFEAHPYDLHFDALSWRMVNRLPVANGEPTGWALQGPYLDEATVAGTGLEPGVYGIARCNYSIMFNNHWTGPTPCSEITVPGTAWPTVATEERVLLHDADSPGLIDGSVPVFTFPDTSWDGDRVLLSFDPGRQGFWRGTELHAQLYPVVGGQLAAPQLDLDLDAMPFRLEPENGYLSALHFHPPAGRLYGVLHRRPYSLTARTTLLFSLDPATGEAAEIAGLYDEGYPPFTFASFGEPPQLYEQIIPIVADTRGAHGGRWHTDLWLYNPSSEPTTVTVTRLRAPDEPTELGLAGHASLRVEDVLPALGGGDGGDGAKHDALLLSSDYRWAEQVVAVGRVWMRDPATGGTYGHAVPSVPAPYGYSNHSVSETPTYEPDVPKFNVGLNAMAAHIDLDLREPGRFRHNLGIVNPSDEEITIQLAWTFHDEGSAWYQRFGPDVEGYRRQTLVVPAHDLVVTDIEALFPAEVVEGWVPRIAVFGLKPAIVWTTMVDNVTGDATFVPFTSYTADSAIQNSPDNLRALEEYRLALPVVASTGGLGGSRWTTDLYGYVWGRGSHWPRIVAAFHPSRPGRCAEPASGEVNEILQGVLAMPVDRWLQTIEWPPDVPPPPWGFVDGLGTIYPDVVHSFAECAGAGNVTGGLEILTGSWFSGFSRTYTTRPDGGTYGGMLPLYPRWGWPVQHFAGLQVDDGFRVNVGFFNGDHDRAVEHRLTLYSADGQTVAERSFTLEPLASLQQELTRLFGLADLPEGAYGLTVLPLDDPLTGAPGRSWAYVSVVDNRTNDPTNLW